MSKNAERPMHLDPGAPPRRKPTPGCKCFLLVCLVLGTLAISLRVATFIVNLVTALSTPHQALYHNISLGDMINRGTVVQPLIGRQQTFDIAATVWLRSTIEDKKNEITDGGEEPATHADDEVSETPLFSEVIFRGVRLSDKNKYVTVNLTLPTAIFQSANLTNYDLRGSLILLPSSPSLLDHVTNFSSWIPESVRPLPVRSWPFPLGSADQGAKTIADKALEDFGVSLPLLQFHGVHSRCFKSGTNTHSHLHDSTNDNSEEDYSEEENERDKSQTERNRISTGSSLKTTNGKPVLQYHPYIVTRTQLRVVDETRLFNRKAYHKAHKQLKNTSCGQGVAGVTPNRYMCDRDYRLNGNWETQLQLKVLNESTGKAQIEWAYGTFLSASTLSAGPRDLVPAPVNRENCTTGDITATSALNLEPQEFMNVSWKISFSGRTPGKLLFGDVFTSPPQYDPDQSERDRILAHNAAELINGLHGHRFYEDAHPRRRMLLSCLKRIFHSIAIFREFYYWYTRTSTISISILGTTLVSGVEIFSSLVMLVDEGRKNKLTIFGWIASLLFPTTVASLSMSLLRLKTVARVEFGWWKETSWVPVLHRVSATHRERASERLEAQTSWRAKGLLLLSLAAIYHLSAPQDLHVIKSLLPAPAADHTKGWPAEPATSSITYTTNLTGRILQLVLNWRARKFAGNHRISAVLYLVSQLISLAVYVPGVVGRFDARKELTVHAVVDVVLLAVTAWQALTLPAVKHTLEDEDAE